jgi:DNA-binding transcriptional regulator YiaG
MNAKDVKQIRCKLAMTQQQFAEHLGVSVSVVSKWEQGTSTPGNLAGKLLDATAREVKRLRTKK